MLLPQKSPLAAGFERKVRLELVNNTHCELVVFIDTSLTNILRVIQQVELVCRVDVHVFVEVVPGTEFDVVYTGGVTTFKATTTAQIIAPLS